MTGAPRFASLTEFHAQAMVLELEAAERYAELADQMEGHNNPEVAALFRKMAKIEAKHVDLVRSRAGTNLASRAPYRWAEPEGPETTPYAEAHYKMTPVHALRLALHNEERAYAFFAAVAEAAEDLVIRDLAAQMADDERRHVALVRDWLARYEAPEPGWADDPDPPACTK